MSVHQAKLFDLSTWQKGDRGLLHASATDKPSLQDVRVYADGTLGPRPGWHGDRQIPQAGPSTYADAVVVRQSGFTESQRFRFLRFGGGQATLFKAGEADVTVALPFDQTNPQRVTQVEPGIALADGVLLDMTTTAMTATLASAALASRYGVNILPKGSEVHQGRAFYFGSTDATLPVEHQNRIWYSDPYDYATFSTAFQHFDIDGWVAGMISLNGNLFIWNTEGHWFVLQGRGNPANGTLNDLGVGSYPINHGAWTLYENYALFLSSGGTSLAVLNPDGSVDDSGLAHLAASPEHKPVLASRAHGDSVTNRVIVPLDHGTGKTRALERGVWYTDTLDEIDASFSYPLQEARFLAGGQRIDGQDTLMVRQAALPGQWTEYLRDAYTGDPVPFSLDGSSTNTQGVVVLPRISEPARRVRLVRATFTVRTYGNNLNVTPYLTCEVNNGLDQTTPALAHSERFDNAPATGISSVEVVATQDPGAFSHFIDVGFKFSDITIENVVVEYEVDNEPVL